MCKKSSKRSNKPCDRLCLDISSPTAKSLGGKQHWLLVMDDCTGYLWSYFLKEKSDLQDEVLGLIKDLKTKYGFKVKIIWCDNAGENKALEDACQQERLGITFEYTAPGTPQQNG